jgi:hypothetical protein
MFLQSVPATLTQDLIPHVMLLLTFQFFLSVKFLSFLENFSILNNREFFPLRLSLRREATGKALTAPWNAGHCEQLQESPAAVTPQDMIQQIYRMYDVRAITVSVCT